MIPVLNDLGCRTGLRYHLILPSGFTSHGQSSKLTPFFDWAHSAIWESRSLMSSFHRLIPVLLSWRRRLEVARLLGVALFPGGAVLILDELGAHELRDLGHAQGHPAGGPVGVGVEVLVRHAPLLAGQGG